MNRRIFFTVLGIGILMAGFVSPANAQMSIVGINPVEGTVGTEVTVYGAGFGVKQGEVLIGVEKCKVLEWSDSQITCEVPKPQAPDEYTLTVLRQGDKKPAEPLTFSYFAMRQPKIFPGDLAQEGVTVTVLGAFFGEKKGDIRLGYLEGGAGGEVVIESPKIVDWSMEEIRFEIPTGMVGKFVLKVSNEVGAGYALLDLGGGMPQSGSIPDPAGWPEGVGWHSRNNGSGVWFKGKFYVFYLNNPALFWDHPTVQCRIFNPTTGSFDSCPGTMPTLYTEAIPVTVVVKDAAGVDKELWLFHVTGSKTILFSRFNGSEWLWIPWAQGLSQTPPVVDWYVTDDMTFEPAAVFNPVTLRVTLYVTYQTHINFATTSDGVHWVHSGAVWPYSDSGLSAVYHQGSVNGKPYDTILAFQDNLGQDFLYYLKDGGVGGVVDQYIIASCSHRASLVNLDNDPAGGVAMIYKWGSDVDSAAIRTLDPNGVWSDASILFTLPDLDAWQGDYDMTYLEQQGYLAETGAIIQWPDGTRHLMLFYLYDWDTWMADENDYTGPFWKMVDVRTLN